MILKQTNVSLKTETCVEDMSSHNSSSNEELVDVDSAKQVLLLMSFCGVVVGYGLSGLLLIFVMKKRVKLFGTVVALFCLMNIVNFKRQNLKIFFFYKLRCAFKASV